MSGLAAPGSRLTSSAAVQKFHNTLCHLDQIGGLRAISRPSQARAPWLQSTSEPSAFAVLAGHAYTAYNSCMQYTIRGIPAAVDNALRERARAAGKSLNEAAVDALAEGSGMTGSRRKRRDLADIAKTWKADKAVEAALADQDRVDEDLWR